MFNSRIIAIDQPALWNSIVRRCSTYDVYHLAQYQRAPTPMDIGTPILAVVEQPELDFVAALPLRLRPVNDIAVIREAEVVGDDILDAASPYGYPGLITSAPADASRRESFVAELDALLKRHSIVSAFIRQHPDIDTSGWLTDPFAPDAIGLTASVDLQLPEDEYQKQTRKSHRADIASWTSREAVFAEHDRFEMLSFGRMYRDTMQRKGAQPRYLFDDAYFTTLGRELGASCRLFSARTARTTVGINDAMAIVLTCGERATYHLAATSDDPELSGLSRWLLERIRLTLKKEGFASFLLGGGVGASGDSLYQFKAGFSKRRPQFEVVRWVGDAALFDKLCEVTGAPKDSDFFPAYR